MLKVFHNVLHSVTRSIVGAELVGPLDAAPPVIISKCGRMLGSSPGQPSASSPCTALELCLSNLELHLYIAKQ